jgi:hypothetical protein
VESFWTVLKVLATFTVSSGDIEMLRDGYILVSRWCQANTRSSDDAEITAAEER